MNTCSITFPGYDARARRGSIRWELFLDRDVRDVLLTERADTLRIEFRGALQKPRGQNCSPRRGSRPRFSAPPSHPELATPSRRRPPARQANGGTLASLRGR